MSYIKFATVLAALALIAPQLADGAEQAVATSAVQGEVLWPSPKWTSASPAEVGLDASKLKQAETYALTAGGSGLVVRHGKAVWRWGDQHQRYDIKSATKSFGATALGIAVKDGKMDLNVPARKYHPTLGVPPESNAQTGWLDQITVLNLATQTAGFVKRGDYQRLLFKPGTHWHYSDGGPNWLAECITLVYRRDLQDLMFERVFTPLGITHDDLTWRKNSYRPAEIDGLPRREFGAGIHANVEALSRIGYLYLHGGRWRDQQIIPQDFVEMATHPVPSVVGLPVWKGERFPNAPKHYGLLWWTNADGELKNVPQDTYIAWGLYDSLIIVIPSLDLVVVRGGESGRQLPRDKEVVNHYDVLEPLLGPIVAAVAAQATSKATGSKHSPGETGFKVVSHSPPYPPSPVITGVRWAPKSTIVRGAPGCDNWPLTWADDGALYGAYGDGNGFEPFVDHKLSVGLVKVLGGPDDFRGVNIRSKDFETTGDGPSGTKASGLLMVDGVLYVWMRNAGNSKLGWSKDHAKTWTWADWKWTASFGCPTFLNFGRNYEGARDDFVYVYSQDSNSAYDAVDSMVLARVRKDKIRDLSAYEYFKAVDDEGRPRWTAQINERGAVFSNPGRCNRSGITYNAGLKRYLWCQAHRDGPHPRGNRFGGGFAIYDAPEPWGPWTTVYCTEEWDVGPGETSSFPTKWMSVDGRTVHLVFSGDDHFSVRRAELQTAN